MSKRLCMPWLGWIALAVTGCAAAPSGAPQSVPPVRVLLVLKAPRVLDDPAWVAQLSQVSGATVQFARAVSPTIAAYLLDCPAHPGDCEPEMARLRVFSEVKSVSVDAVKHLP